ncbi:threonine ammonia-lyase [Marinisporobacter balticus]|uniref:threonine ammonia-lyase n=1 Tax=Marinisporobacter balticus TaxID=2018667 RepID=A0A4R2KVP9_9FIRM|nr:pyridoxal-phosphate dependent enzyme [Marinisporobacter balticus]TCO76907.1 threonine dehydratase [Marinisporobacter balticus]
MLKYKDVTLAYERIKEHISTTALEKSFRLSDKDSEVFLKLDNQQPVVKSYKIRGAMSKATSLTEEDIKRGVTAISSGNHGASLAYTASKLGIEQTEIFVPETTPFSKVEKIRCFGAKVNKVGKNYDEAHHIGEQKINERGLIEVNPCEDPICIAGAGTVALEILKQNPEINVILVPIGGGGLITGIGVYAKHINPNIEVIGVQTKASPAMKKSLEDKVCYEYFEASESICDALIGGIAKVPYEMADKCIDDVIIVAEEAIGKATVEILKHEKIVCEPSSATVYAAYKENRERFKGKKVALVITGGNIGDEQLKSLIDQYY